MLICGEMEGRDGGGGDVGVVAAVVQVLVAAINSSAKGGPVTAENAEGGSMSPPPKGTVDQSSAPKPVEGASIRESATAWVLSKQPY